MFHINRPDLGAVLFYWIILDRLFNENNISNQTRIVARATGEGILPKICHREIDMLTCYTRELKPIPSSTIAAVHKQPKKQPKRESKSKWGPGGKNGKWSSGARKTTAGGGSV